MWRIRSRLSPPREGTSPASRTFAVIKCPPGEERRTTKAVRPCIWPRSRALSRRRETCTNMGHGADRDPYALMALASAGPQCANLTNVCGAREGVPECTRPSGGRPRGRRYRPPSGRDEPARRGRAGPGRARGGRGRVHSVRTCMGHPHCLLWTPDRSR